MSVDGMSMVLPYSTPSTRMRGELLAEMERLPRSVMLTLAPAWPLVLVRSSPGTLACMACKASDEATF